MDKSVCTFFTLFPHFINFFCPPEQQMEKVDKSWEQGIYIVGISGQNVDTKRAKNTKIDKIYAQKV